MSDRLRIAMDERDKGFTLIELLVVIIIAHGTPGGNCTGVVWVGI